MKKFLVFFGFFLFASHLACWAAPWGMDPEYKPAQTQEEKEKSVGEGHLLRSFLQGKTVRITLWIENERYGEFERFSHFIIQSYQSWFDNAAKRIIKKRREQEFADVLPYLQRPLSIEVVRGEDADMKVKVYATRKNMRKDVYKEDWKERIDCLGVYSQIEKFIAISKQHSIRQPKEVLLHEIGHSLGFADQYYRARWRADEVYSSNSLDSIMNGEETSRLTCDDADGLINLIDLTLGLNRGGEKGWISLCSATGDSYKAGMSTRTNRYRVGIRDDDSVVIEEYEHGKKISAVQFRFAEEDSNPFAIVEEEKVLKRSPGGIPALVKGKNGEEIYYIRAYERFEKIVTKDGKLISHLYTYPIPPYHIGVLKKIRYKGEIGFLKGEINADVRPLGATFDLPNKQVKAIVRLDKKRDNSLVEFTWYGPWKAVFSSNDSKEVFDSSFLEQSIFEKGFLEWAKTWPQYIHSIKK